MTDETIFATALEKADPAERAAFLAEACGDDTARRERLEGLLMAHAGAANFLERPPVAAHDPDHGATQALTGTPDPGVASAQITGGENGSPHDESLTFLVPPTRPDALGRIGHYEVLQVLGQGGFGIVFRAFDVVLHRVVAVKVLSPQMAATSPARKRFLREARSSAQVRHENVVQVYEVGEQPLPYLVMEFIPGETLQQRLDRVGPVEPAEVVRVGRQIAEGLAAAHGTDLIHRDIKPGNILLEGGAQRVKITDFGLARAADDASISQSGIIAGTPMYMAPEQALGHKLDQRADLFSLGSVLYQMAAGRPPFRANNTVAVLKRVAEDTPRDIREIIPETPQWLCGVITKLHAKNPAERFQSAREVADLLADCEAKLKAKQEVKNVLPDAVKPARRKWVAAAAILLLPVIALTVTEFAGVTHLFRAPAAQDPIKGSDGPTAPVQVAETEPSAAVDWVPLFNGKNLAGWQGDLRLWTVENGVLVTRIPKDAPSKSTAMVTVRNDYQDFHVRLEAKINDGGDSSLFFRLRPGGTFLHAQIKSAEFGNLMRKADTLVKTTSTARPNHWFTMELIAKGPRVVVRVDGKDVVDWTDPEWVIRSGHIGFETGFAGTEFYVRRIEIKELPTSSPPLAVAPFDAAQARAYQEAWAKYLKLPVEAENKRGMKMILIPPASAALPKAYYLGKYEVTQGEWETVMGYNPSAFGPHNPKVAGMDTSKYPVEMVSWYDSVEFCRLSEREGLKPYYELTVTKRGGKDGSQVEEAEVKILGGNGYHVPRDAEWAHGCVAGAKSKYHCGDKDEDLLEYAWFKDNCDGRTHGVGEKKPNAFGLYDMHGNVNEWNERILTNAETITPKQAVNRGGAWHWPAGQCAVSHWWPFDPKGRVPYLSPSVGLRVARDPTGASSPEAKTPPIAIAPFTDADVQRIAALPAGEQVEEVRNELMRRNPGFDGQVGHKIVNGVVTEFRIVADQVTDIAPIRVWNALRVLDCRGTWTNKANVLLADLTPLEGMNLAGLTHLDLSNTQVDDAGMVYFKDCKNLTSLRLERTQVGDAGLAHFKDCKALAVLGLLGSTNVSDAGLANFKDCKHLTSLSLHWTNVGDAGLVHFQDCKHLHLLGLGGTKVSDAGLTNFKDCKDLTHLNLHRTKVSDVALAHFKGMRLRELYIYDTGITDVTPLQGMPLNEIRLTAKNITRGLGILRDMKNLKTIGISFDQSWPAAEFWERYDKGEFK